MVEILLAKVECKQIVTNHWQKWVSADFSFPNMDAISSSEFASCVPREQHASFSDGRYDVHLRLSIVIMNMEITLDQEAKRHAPIFNDILCTLSSAEFFNGVHVNPLWTNN